MLRRFLPWLLGAPTREQLQAGQALDAERDRHRTGAISEANRGNWTGKGPGTTPRDLP
jgi:hypothetical protein